MKKTIVLLLIVGGIAGVAWVGWRQYQIKGIRSKFAGVPEEQVERLVRENVNISRVVDSQYLSKFEVLELNGETGEMELKFVWPRTDEGPSVSIIVRQLLPII